MLHVYPPWLIVTKTGLWAPGKLGEGPKRVEEEYGVHSGHVHARLG